ncbi:MAG: hypothetical protein V3V29_04030 [Acidimicrobiia bacterium]
MEGHTTQGLPDDDRAEIEEFLPDREFEEPRAGSLYDPAPVRERLRGRLAVIFTLLLVVTALGPIALVAWDITEWETIELPTTMAFGSVVGIVGAVLGFYFGGHGR